MDLKSKILKDVSENYRFLSVKTIMNKDSINKIAMVYSSNITFMLDFDNDIELLLIFTLIRGVDYETKNKILGIKDEGTFDDIKINGSRISFVKKLESSEESQVFIENLFKILPKYNDYKDYMKDNSKLYKAVPNEYMPIESETALTAKQFEELTEEGHIYENAFKKMIDNYIKSNKTNVNNTKNNESVKEEVKIDLSKKDEEKKEQMEKTQEPKIEVKEEPVVIKEKQEEKIDKKDSNEDKKEVSEIYNTEVVLKKLSNINNKAEDNYKLLKQNKFLLDKMIRMFENNTNNTNEIISNDEPSEELNERIKELESRINILTNENDRLNELLNEKETQIEKTTIHTVSTGENIISEEYLYEIIGVRLEELPEKAGLYKGTRDNCYILADTDSKIIQIMKKSKNIKKYYKDFTEWNKSEIRYTFSFTGPNIICRMTLESKEPKKLFEIILDIFKQVN